MKIKLTLMLFFVTCLLYANDKEKQFDYGPSIKEAVNCEVSVTYAEKIGTTPPVYMLAPVGQMAPEKRAANKSRRKQVPNFYGRGDRMPEQPNALPMGEDKLRQKSIKKSLAFEVIPDVNMDGINSGNGTPPDPSGDIGINYYMQAVNATTIRVHNKDGSPASSPFTGNSLWSSIGFSSAGDPIIIFDEEAERWLITEFPSGNQLLVAISVTGDPLGEYDVYNFATPNFPDYPKYSVWDEAYVVTTNEQGPGTLPNYFINREELLAGANSVTIQRITVPSSVGSGPGFFVGTPVDWNGTTPPPASTNPTMVYLYDDNWSGVSQDAIRVVEFDINWNNSNQTSTDITTVPTGHYDSYPCSMETGGFACVPQPNGSGLDGIPETIMHQAHYRNFGSYEAMLINFITDADGNNTSGIRWIEMRKSGSQDWSVYQEGTYAPDDGFDRYMGATAMDGYGNIGLVFAYSGPDAGEFASLAFTGRKSNDPLGEMTVDEYILVEGTGAQNFDRFGDYAQLSVDPVENSFWFTGEYMGNGGSWRTRIASFTLGRDTTDVGPTALVAPVTSGDLTDNEEITVEVTNFGLEIQFGFPIGYSVNGGATVVESCDVFISPDETATFTFAQKADFSQVGEHTVEIFTALEGDQADNNDVLNVVVTKLPRDDAGVSAINGIPESVCGSSVTVDLVLTNFGSDALTSCDVAVRVNDNPTVVVPWAGLIPPGESTTYTFPVTGLEDGNNTVIAYTENPNGETDEIPTNDQVSRSFNVVTSGVAVFFELFTDSYPDETSWEIENASGSVVLSGGGYSTPASTTNEEWCLSANECFTFTIFDSFGDGMQSFTGIEGDYTITDSEGTVLADLNDPGFGNSESNTFCVNATCNLSADIIITPESTDHDDDAALLITPLNGIGIVSISIDGGTNFTSTGLFTGLASGFYGIVLQDENDCTYEEEIYIPACALELTVTTTTEPTGNLANGALNILINGGSGPYTYMVFDGNEQIVQNSPNFSNLINDDYYIQVLDAGGCTIGIDYTLGEPTSISGINQSNLNIFPNPTDGVFKINLSGVDYDSVFMPFKIFDNSGKFIDELKLVRYDDTYTTQVSLVPYPSGVYYIVINNERVKMMRPVIKN